MAVIIKYGSTEIGEIKNGQAATLGCKDQKMKDDVVVEADLKLQEKIATKNGEVLPDGEYDALSKVIVNVGNSPKYQEKNVTPTEDYQYVRADPEYDAISEVTVSPIPDEYKKTSGAMVIESSGTHDVSSFAEVIIAEGQLDKPTVILDSSTNQVKIVSQVKAKGYVSDSDTSDVLTDANLVSQNIKKNISIFGVVGTYDPVAGETGLDISVEGDMLYISSANSYVEGDTLYINS